MLNWNVLYIIRIIYFLGFTNEKYELLDLILETNMVLYKSKFSSSFNFDNDANIMS